MQLHFVIIKYITIFIKYCRKVRLENVRPFHFSPLSFYTSELIFVEWKLGYGRLKERHAELTSSHGDWIERFSATTTDAVGGKWWIALRTRGYRWQMTNDEQFATMIIYVDWEQNTIRRTRETVSDFYDTFRDHNQR